MKTIIAGLALGLAAFAPAATASAANITFTISGAWFNGSFTFDENDVALQPNPFGGSHRDYRVSMTQPVFVTYASLAQSWSGNLVDRVDYIQFGEDGFIDMATEWNQITFDSGSTFLKDGYFTLGEHRLAYGTVPGPTMHRLVVSADGPIRQPEVQPPVAGAVPEPGSWATMIAGFALAGVAMRRRAPARGMA